MSKKILLVEDESIIALTEKKMLETHGYEVIPAYTGEKAIELFEKHQDISLVLMDIDLGIGIDGTETAEKILNTHSVPIVFLSKHAEKEYVDKVKQIPNYGYVLKNTGEFVLLETIHTAYELFAAHQQTRMAEQKFRSYIEHAPEGVILTDLHGKILEVNPAMEEMSGYTREELSRMFLADFMPQESGKKIETGDFAGVRFDRGEPPYQKIVQKDGSTGYWAVSSTQLSEDRVLSFAKETNYQKEMEEALRKERDRAQKYLDIAGVMIVAFDKEGKVSLINRKGCALLGYSQEEIIGKRWPENFVPEGEKYRVKEVFESLLEGKSESVARFENSILTKNGEERVITWNNIPLYDETGALDGFLSSAEDVTEWKKTKTQLQNALEEKDFLLKELNHRVKNNLAMISSLISLKESSIDDGTDLSDIIHQINAIRIVHEKLFQSDTITEIPVKRYIEELVTMLFSSFTTNNIHIDTYIEEISIRTKTAIPLGLIINEIATNAIKHGFNSGGEEHFRIEFFRDNGDDSQAERGSARSSDRKTVGKSETSVDTASPSSPNNECSYYLLKVSNTGGPFPEHIDFEHSSHLGLSLIKTLAVQLDGELELVKAPYPQFTIRFPYCV